MTNCAKDSVRYLRSFRYWLSILVIIVVQIVGASCSSIVAIDSKHDRMVATGSDATGLLLEESVPKPFQPSEEKKARLDTIYVLSPAERAAGKPSVVLKGNLPLFPYMYLESENTYAVHPMAMGRYIKEKATKEQLEMIVSLAAPTKNDGLAWFYPSHYKNVRMQGPFWRYSCISQGTILAGFTRRAINTDGDFSIARKVFKGMMLDYFEGGVNLENRALLEMPSYLGAPEIILNGWLDALIHIQDYAEASGDEEAQEFLLRNLLFLAETLDHFDVPGEEISRYSDLCPYRISLRTENVGIPEYYVEYRPLHEGFRSMRYKLRELSQETMSLYDNQITGRNGNILKATISASALYDTVILSSAPFEVTLNTGTMNLVSSTPSGIGKVITAVSKKTERGLHELILDADWSSMIRGYPTNFSKTGKQNLYHSYHIVALMLLAKNCPIPEMSRKQLLSYALKWKSYISTKPIPRDYSFSDLDKVFATLNLNRAVLELMDYPTLQSWATNN